MRGPLRDFSIRSKLTGMVVAITSVSLVLGFLFVVLNDIRTFKRDMVDSTVLVARVIGDYSVGDLAFEDRGESARTLGRLATIPNVEQAFLYDGRGQLFSSYSRHGEPGTPPPGAAPEGEFRQGVLHVSQTIFYKGEKYGTLHLLASTAALESKIRRHLGAMALVILLLVALSFLGALEMQKAISGPILDLADTARRISAEHDYSVRVAKVAEDEIGTLCDGFNDMLAQIERRQREREEADQRTREKSQFLANMSHELRTPLNSIIGFSEILLTRLEDRLSPRELKFLQNIHGSGQHLLGIINDILDLSKVEAGRMEVHPERVAVSTVVDAVCAIMRGVSAKRLVGFEVAVPEDLPPIEADPVKLKQVLYNLASNAVKFSPEGATVRISARHLPASGSPLEVESVQVSVADQGPGIDPKDHGLIFQEFRQASRQPGRTAEGTGLGLALVRRFLDLHEGRIDLDSALGRGSTFTVTLPRYFRGATPPETAGAEAPRVLVVEDEAAAYRRLSQVLRQAGYATLWARSGEEAVNLARGLKPSAITLDVLLGGMDGWQVLKELKRDADTRALPVIMVTVMENQELGLALGAADYFVKPVDHDMLVQRLRTLVPPGAARPRVLLIDDDPSAHEILGSRLGSEGYELEHARSGPEGLARASERPPSAVLLDLMMDGMDGFEVAVRLKEDPRTEPVPIVVLTAKDVTRDEQERLRGRISVLVRKGRSDGQLLAVLDSLLGRKARAPRPSAPA